MRSLYVTFFKNITWIYLSILCCFAYQTMLDAIPDHVYLEEGQELELDQKLPVQLGITGEGKSVQTAAASTFENIRKRKNESASSLGIGKHTLTCYLLGLLPVKEVEVSVVPGQSLYAGGHVVGIYGATQGVLVLGTSPVEKKDGSFQEPAENIIFEGDYITEINGHEIKEKEELISGIQKYGAYPMVLTLWRGSEQIDVSVEAVETKDSYMLGLWVKDDMAGIGTLTYYDSHAGFGALGHGIGDGKTGDLLRLSRGSLYNADVIGIKKGKRGDPGELEGVVYYGAKNKIGTVSSNTDIGIYGTLATSYCEKLKKEDRTCAVCYKQDVKEGEAEILSDVSGGLCRYKIVIDSLDYTPGDRNKGIRFHVSDEKLLDLTGGIVQGLSGSPILQDNKIVGAVTHVLVNDPEKGYGIFVENMLAD